ncbi:MAG: FAD binding domain-containing protein [Acidimicrobiia bacterium]|nr:FAD binding domain-containing protein [Acidimicrobiia bacterium]
MHQVQRPGTSAARIVRPADVDGALHLLAEHGAAARVVAGATDLLLEMERGGHQGLEVLVDVTGIAGLDGIVELDDGRIRLGPLVTHNQVVASGLVWQRAAPLAQACFEIGSPQLRNRATVVGNVVTASPANDSISPLRVLDATISLRSSRGQREVSLAGFHTGVRRSVMADDELVTALTFRPLADDETGVFLKVGNRVAQAISIVHGALVARPDGDGYAVRVALGSVAPTIIEFDAHLVDLDDSSVESFAGDVAAQVQPIDDVRATAGYRTEAVRTMIRRGLLALRDSRTVRPERPALLSASGTAHSPGTHGSFTDRDTVEMTVNGLRVAATHATSTTLLDWLRDVAGPASGISLTGTKEGCAEGECGACTVLLNGAAVMACLVPAASAAGGVVTTVEGIAIDEGLHPIQQAFIDSTAVQCGYCIPGFLVACASLLSEQPSPTRTQIVDGLAGNLCRCTGYYRMIEAVESVGGRP